MKKLRMTFTASELPPAMAHRRGVRCELSLSRRIAFASSGFSAIRRARRQRSLFFNDAQCIGFMASYESIAEAAFRRQWGSPCPFKA